MTQPTVLTFDSATVTLDAVQRAGYSIADIATVNITSAGDGWVCELHPREGVDVTAVEHRLRAEVLDQVLRSRIAAETEPVRNLVLALAYSRTGLVGDDRDVPAGDGR